MKRWVIAGWLTFFYAESLKAKAQSPKAKAESQRQNAALGFLLLAFSFWPDHKKRSPRYKPGASLFAMLSAFRFLLSA